jgi:hypothetical protein
VLCTPLAARYSSRSRAACVSLPGGVGRVDLQELREQIEHLALELCPLLFADPVDVQAATSRRQTMRATR